MAQGSENTGTHRGVAWAVGAVVAGAIIVVLVWSFTAARTDSAEDGATDVGTASGTTSTATPEAPETSADPTSSAPPSTDLVDGDAEELVAAAIETVVTTSPDTAAATALDGLATGPFVAEIEAQFAELDVNGWTIEGVPSIVSATVTDSDLTTTPPVATVEACIDSSDVRMLDSSGTQVPGATSPRALNVFTLEWDGSRWLIANRTFPNDPTC